jgi:hypothetical protein
LNVFVKQAALQSDDDLDAYHMADAGSTALTKHFVDTLPDHVGLDTAPVADADMWHHIIDGGHALFA